MAQPVNYNPHTGLLEDGEDKRFDFSEQSIRKAFLRKVYAILSCQLLVTLGFILVFVYTEHVREWAKEHKWLLWCALIAAIVTVIAMACCESVRRTHPMNLIFLGIFTVALSLMLGFVTSVMEPEVVMLAVGITSAVCFALTLFALQTRWDFTVMGGILFSLFVVLFLFGIIAFFVRDRIMNLVYASLGAVLFSFYLVYDTQLMLGGNHKYSISPEEYVFAALNLYLDIIHIFMYMLRIVSGR